MKGKIKLSAFIILIFYGLIFLTIILIGGISLFATFRYAEDTGAQTMDQKLTAAESNVERMTDSLKRELAVEGTNPVVLDHSLPVDFRSDVFAEAAEKSDFIEFSVALSSGITYNSGGQINISDRDYFTKAIEGVPYISSPLMSRKQDALYMFAASKLIDGSGVVFGLISPETFNAALESVKLGHTGFVFVLDSQGVVISYPDSSVVNACADFGRLAQSGAGDTVFFEMLSKATPDMIAGKSETVELDSGGDTYLVSYRPVEGPEGWSVGAVVPKQELFANFNSIRDITLTVIGVMLIIGLIAAFLVARVLSRPVVRATERIVSLAEGDLHTAANIKTLTKEHAHLNESLEYTINYLKRYIDDIDYVLGEIANGHLDVESRIEYKGSFVNIGLALGKIIDTLGETISIISESTESISAGSVQISKSAQSLLTGSLDAAGSIKNIDVNIENIGDNLADTVADTTDASTMADLARQTAIDGNAKMQELLNSIDGINKAAEAIQHINKTIDDIAFQTNILSLNAAVEAARAGNAGRGFAVVADEVSMLAGRCAKAAGDTAELIDDVLKAARAGTASAAETAETLNRIVEQSEKVNKIISALSDGAVKQANEMSEVGRDMERLSSVTTATSATSEEFAETSKSFEQQAVALEHVVASFKLRRNHGSHMRSHR